MDLYDLADDYLSDPNDGKADPVGYLPEHGECAVRLRNKPEQGL